MKKKSNRQPGGDGKYAEFGLDAQKRSTDAGTTGKSYCHWCRNERVSYGFALCFNNWVICPACVTRGLATTPPAGPDSLDYATGEPLVCFTCRTRQPLYLSPAAGCQYGLCRLCLRSAAEVIENYLVTAQVTKPDKKGQFGLPFL